MGERESGERGWEGGMLNKGMMRESRTQECVKKKKKKGGGVYMCIIDRNPCGSIHLFRLSRDRVRECVCVCICVYLHTCVS